MIKSEIMCFKNKPIVINPAEMRMVSFGKNIYGGANGLNGCVNDTQNLPSSLQPPFPNIDIRRFTNYDVTVARYEAVSAAAISTLSPGATVCLIADSCFSQGITRGNPSFGIYNGYPIKNRFYPNPRYMTRVSRNKQVFMRSDLRWLVISGCREHETSADAFFKKYNQYMGALSCSLMESFEKGMTWQEWYNAMMVLIIAAGFNQRPTFEGIETKKNEIIGSSETLIIHNSSHGTQVVDINGDELDKYDEAIYFDKPLIDDRIGLILDKIPLAA
jgi:hypothetical protein